MRVRLYPEKIAYLVEEIISSTRPRLCYQLGEFAVDRAKDRFKDPSGDDSVLFKRKLLEVYIK